MTPKQLANKKIILMAGYPGSGKSTIAKKICQKYGFDYLSSDLLRKKLFNQERFDSKGDKLVTIARRNTYPEMYKLAAKMIKDSKKVVIDASHMDPSIWQPAAKELNDQVENSEVCFLLVKTPEEEIRSRMSKLTQMGNEAETVFEAWNRVFGYFKAREARGEVSWPDKNSGIEIFIYDEKEF